MMFEMTRCQTCNGTGQYCTQYPRCFSPCGLCGGTGKVRTYSELGREIQTGRWSKQNRLKWEARWPLTLALLDGWGLASEEWKKWVDFRGREHSR